MALTYNQPRFAQNLLNKFKKSPPSFSISLYDDHWTLNKGPSKFLYTQPVSGLLEEVRALRIPVDFIEIFDAANVQYFDGCMIVESIDYRKPRTNQQTGTNEPESVRVVLQPTPESFYADLCLLNAKNGNKWTDQEALEIESKILNATCPPLCLEPDVNLTRIVNTVIRASTASETVLSKRKQVHEPEEDENDKAKRAKLLSQYMHPHNGKPSSQAQTKRSMFDVLHEVAQKDEKGNYVLKWKPAKPNPAAYVPQGQPQNNHTFAPPMAVSAPPAQPPAPPAQSVPEKIKLKIGKRPDLQEGQLALSKGKKNPVQTSNVPTQGPSPVPEQKKPPVVPGTTGTPVGQNSMAASTSNAPPQYQPPQPPKGVLKKPEEQGTQQPPHPAQPHQQNSMEQTHPPAAWQPPVPSAQYLSQPPQGKKKPAAQPQQTSPFHSHTPIPGFQNNNGFPQNPAFKNVGAIPQNPNMNPNRGSPMAHNQPLLSRSPLPPHTQSPRTQPQQPQQPAQSTPPHQMPQHPAHPQFNMHMQAQNRFNPAMQGQMGHHPHPVPAQHGVPQQQHHGQHPNVPRAGQPQQHDQQAMMQHMQHYNAAMQQQFPYSQMHVQGMMNGMRMPGAQGAGGQFMPNTAGWRMPAAGRGGGPMTTVPMGMTHGQTFQHSQMMAGLTRTQPQQQQPQGQGR